MYIDDVLSHQIPVFLTIVGGQSDTTIYVDGRVVKKVSNFGLSSQELTGQFIIGNAPATTDNWAGQMTALAVYDRGLTADEVSQHFADWTSNQHRDIVKTKGAIAMYLFDEGGGNIVHNHADSVTDLLIPERFFVLHEQFLERPWDEFRPDWNYLKDIAINVAGFIPLGFFFCAYFSLVQGAERPAAITIAFGFAVSLTIEILQAFLPTRDSGMTDLITNTLGTTVGVVSFRQRATQALLTGSLLTGPRRSQ